MMNGMILLPTAARSAVLVVLFLLLIFQLMTFCYLQGSRMSWRKKTPALILAAAGLILLSFLAEGSARDTFQDPMWAVTKTVMQIPAAVVLTFLVLSCLYTVWILRQGRRERKHTITRESIRESANSLPMGLCFARSSGQPFLVNRKMESLSQELCGETLQNAESFWQTVSEGILKNEAMRSRVLDIPAVILPDGAAWVFDRQTFTMDGQEVVQMTATDATELYGLTCRLKQENSVLRGMNARLKLYGRKVEDLTRTQERLAMKVRIHDSIGQNLMATRYFLAQEAQGIEGLSLDPILQKWHQSIAMLRREEMPEETIGALKYLTDAAESAGVRVVVSGTMPDRGAAVEFIVAAGAEALTNAVRHADAKTLKIAIQEMPLVYSAVFTNDGELPEAPLQEGGGLSGLRKRIEAAGGTMFVSIQPEFALKITIPKEAAVQK